MIAAILAASIAAAPVIQLPDGAFDSVWTTPDNRAFLGFRDDGFGVTTYAGDSSEPRELECVYTGQIPGVFQVSASCSDGLEYVVTFRNEGADILDATAEFGGLTFHYGH